MQEEPSTPESHIKIKILSSIVITDLNTTQVAVDKHTLSEFASKSAVKNLIH